MNHAHLKDIRNELATEVTGERLADDHAEDIGILAVFRERIAERQLTLDPLLTSARSSQSPLAEAVSIAA